MTSDEIHRHLESLEQLWGTPGLAEEVKVRPSTRMYRSLGNYSPKRDEIRIAAHLLETGGREFFLEVLGHEAAHAAIRRLYGNRVQPHGREWKALMRKAGLPPRATLDVPEGVARFVAEKRAQRRRRPRTLWGTIRAYYGRGWT
ncbi:MAG: SprT-like domain-containing protein [Candidatus Eisenbacteria bacterium]|uniref:SprT-like domain-containing protein n=1 Tax=Eiseniibacteriota bacterium TaxID=2212470 RepID=A0A956NDH4_UNCEI|nr:SprT-like domain-containing protein [Candidatus Eisenbacteria bacterium]MCB9465916.1 SprT-like domain-containing protein [Candidatus Eisenbacteria bacterium]